MLIDEVRQLASAARAAFEGPPRIRLQGKFADQSIALFPYGCCHDVCLLLAELYRERGCTVLIARGWRATASHVWLVVDGVVVDLTADQFEGEMQAAVIVTTISPWHDTWESSAAPVVQAIEDYASDDPWRAWLAGAVVELRRRLAVSRCRSGTS